MSVAKSYAKALYETAKESGQPVEPIERELEQFGEILEKSREAHIALCGPVTAAKEKMAATEAIAQKMGLSDTARRFLSLLAKKERLSILREIHEALTEVRLAAEGGVSGKLLSAEPMSASDVEGLAAAFSKKLGKKVAFRFYSDPSLLAGVKVTVNGVTYDGTLRSQLQRLRDQVAAGVSH
jgi:F-type H+-transporting ATPase subunit delta